MLSVSASPSIHPLHHLESDHPLLHPPYCQQVTERLEQPVPYAVMRLSCRARMMADRHLRDGETLHFDEGGQETVRAVEELHVRDARALERSVTTARVRDRFARKLVAHPVGDFGRRDPDETVTLPTGLDPRAAHAIRAVQPHQQ